MKNKINVNISPNPLDLQTLHCSQNDTGERKFYFTLHNNGEVIDTTDISDPIFEPFDVYKGGTEELLPTNTSTPTTSPIDADIQYPQGLLNDQVFTYRESPAIQDGLARIDKIKGNTLVWNQLQKATANTSTVNGITYTNNGDGSWSVSGTATASAQKALAISADWITAISGHKYLMVGGLPNGGSSKWLMQLYKNNANTLVGTDSGNGLIYTADDTTVNLSIYFTVYNGNTVNGRIYPQIFDLTKMGLDSITSVSEFTLLFPLYYSYESGKLLSFNGTGIKTVGFNQWDEEWEIGAITAQGTPSITAGRIRSKNFIPAEPSTRYFRKTPNNLQPFFYDENQQFIEYGLWGMGNFITPSNCAYMKFQVDPVYGLSYKNDICINISNTELNGKYEPYKASSSSIPISQYFPTGMKSAGNVYDELTSNKAVTRVGQVDLGTLTWQRLTSYTNPFFATQVAGRKTGGAIGGNYECALYNKNLTYRNSSTFGPNASNMDIAFSADTNSTYIYVRNDSYSTTDAFKTAMSGVLLNYELATYTEQDIKTASLVCKNIDTPCYLSNGELVCDAIEDLTSESGFFDAKLKLKDSSSVAYSSKFKLHVEDL